VGFTVNDFTDDVFGPTARRIIAILKAAVGVFVLLTVYLALAKHLQTACYSRSAITSEAKAVEAAKDLVIKERIFNFPRAGTSEDFIASLAGNANCCGARKDFSFTYMSSVWTVALVSKEYFTLIEMDECGQKLFNHGSTGND
jgi:hypothetical protein